MSRDYVLDGNLLDGVSLVIGAIGIVIPLLYGLFTYHLLRREKFKDREHLTGVRSFLKNLQRSHASDIIRERGRSSPHASEARFEP